MPRPTIRAHERAMAAIERACGGLGRTPATVTVDELLSRAHFTLEDLAAIARVTGDTDATTRLVRMKLRAIGVSVTNDRY